MYVLPSQTHIHCEPLIKQDINFCYLGFLMSYVFINIIFKYFNNKIAYAPAHTMTYGILLLLFYPHILKESSGILLLPLSVSSKNFLSLAKFVTSTTYLHCLCYFFLNQFSIFHILIHTFSFFYEKIVYFSISSLFCLHLVL